MSDFVDDISQLSSGELGEVQMPTNDEPYDDAKYVSRATPPAGKYTLQLPDEIGVGAWPESDKGPGSFVLKFETVKIIGTDIEGVELPDGMEIMYQQVSTRLNFGGNSSSATDLLQRQGITPFPRNGDEWQDAAQQLSGAVVYGVYCDWECRSPKTYTTEAELITLRDFLKGEGLTVTKPGARRIVLRGMRNFPSNDEGTAKKSRLVFDEGPDGESLTLYANLVPTLRGYALTAEERAERDAA